MKDAIFHLYGASGSVRFADIPAMMEGLGNGAGDTTLGLYARGGGIFRIGNLFQIGVDLRALGATAELGTGDTSVGYVQAGLLLGWGW